MANENIDLLKLLEKAAEQLDDPNTATTDDLLNSFFENLQSVVMEQIPVAKGATGPFTKVRLQGMHDVLEAVTKMSDDDLAQWLRISTPTNAKVYDGGKAKRFDARTKPGDPDGGFAAGKTPSKDLGDAWNPSATGKLPGASTGKELRGKAESATVIPSSYPAPGMAKSVGDFLDAMADATPEEIDRAKTGFSQLSPDVVATINKAITDRGQMLQSIEATVSSDEEAALYMGAMLSEQELRKGIIVNSASLLERVAKMRDTELAKQRIVVPDTDDDWEQRARQGNA